LTWIALGSLLLWLSYIFEATIAESILAWGGALTLALAAIVGYMKRAEEQSGRDPDRDPHRFPPD
jgi:hypothetical protein